MRPPSALESLRAQVRQIEGRHRQASTALPFRVAAVDTQLPNGGLAQGALHEVAGGGNGAIDGAAAALFRPESPRARTARLLWCAGLKSDRVIYLEAGDEKSVLDCFEEGLRHGGLGAVVAEVAKLNMKPPGGFSSPQKRRGASALRCAAGAARPRRRISASQPPPRPVGASRRCLRRRCPSLASAARARWSS